MKIRFLLLFILSTGTVAAGEIERVSLPLIPDLRRADIYFLKVTATPEAILVLCPGFNGNGRDWIQNPAWQEFARIHNLGLVGLSFASDGNQLRKGQGYYYPAQGSGRLLLQGVDHAFGPDLPLYLYGFSGGAHFTSGFAEWKPDRVAAWCAYSAEWWSKPSPQTAAPPGLVICGNNDERLGASLLYFKQGRALARPWLWMGVPNDNHSVSARAEDFVRHYFSAILENQGAPTKGEWVDVDLKQEAKPDLIANEPSLTGWLPSAALFAEWEEVHQP